jgi:hypothetical protein
MEGKELDNGWKYIEAEACEQWALANGYRKIPSRQDIQQVIYNVYFPTRNNVKNSKMAAEEILKLINQK